MRSRFLRIASLFVAATVASCATTVDERPQKAMVVVPIEDARFAPVLARLPEGPRMAVLWGDPNTGPSAMLLEMKRGAGPMHTHTADYHLVVIEGTMKHWGAGEKESDAKPLGPGSYWFQPGGLAHADACLSGRCVMQVVWSARRDGMLAQSPKP
jgi:quercetin dioxygenase-like cupin family protein